jgi:hypothetical protein
MKARFKRGWWKTYGTLTPGNVYRVIGIEGDQLRINSDVGEPILFAAHAFDIVDATEPDDWIGELGQDGERYAGPRALSARGFFEDWHDGVAEARAKLSAYLHHLCWLEAKASNDSANTYIRLRWKHTNEKDPVVLYSELDESRYEVRKIEEFIGGRMTYAEGRGTSGDTRLGELPVPELAQLAANPDFEPEAMSRHAFEELWDKVAYADVEED